MSTTAEWTLLEKLMLAQAVYKLGEEDWVQIASNLNQNSLLNRQPDFFNKEHCSQEYTRLLENLGIEKSSTSTTDETSVQQKERPVVKLAKQLYTQRVSELKRDLEETNAKYSTLTHEIEEIRAGKWDDRLLANAGRQDTTSAPSSTTSPTRDNDTTMQEADATPTTTVKTEPMDTTNDTTTTTTPSMNETNASKEREIKKEPSESSPIVTASESSSTLQPPSAEPISEVPQNTSSTSEKVVAATDANAEVPTSMPSPSAIPITQGSSSLSSSPPPKTTAISGADDNQPPSPKPSSPSKPAEQPVDNTTATIDTQPLIESTTSQNEIQQPDGETRQETANVPSMVLAPTPKEALSAEPHMTTHPTLPVQMEPRPPSGQPGSEDSFHSAEELDTTHQQQQQQPAAAAAATTTTTSVQETTSSPPQMNEKPSSNVPIEQRDNTTTQPSPMEENEDDVNLKRKADEEISGDMEHKRPRMDNENASVTQPPDSSEAAISDLVTQPTPGESPESHRRAPPPPQHDSPTPSSAAQTPASNAKSPEAAPSSTMADTESVTGSESNAPTPTASTGSTRKHKDEQRQQKSWQKNINLLWREIANHKNGAVFMNPIKEATAPLYYQIIKHPMDLKAIKNRIREGAIKSTLEFERDIVLMLANSLMYNREGTEMYQMALEMLEDVSEQIKLFKTADSNSPPTSHTRKASTIAKDRRKSMAD
ncbi:hypothetical protein O0I10_005175 [Lichtheimia ornata]|uniref:Bromo domain-containing protein n=1 Tax=Lichtheimia ornata TaxID=688661 RepID=A0AAD7XZV1_9FUNG|nr:uncharacterized protein O0I10_005175 [Lichtheimia ornata]KAJ8659136.1 hypothetical protein O0I10_005175 [Lichtheimia ornata]